MAGVAGKWQGTKDRDIEAPAPCTPADPLPIFGEAGRLSRSPTLTRSSPFMFNDLCDDAHEAHSLKQIHRVVMVIGAVFLTFGGIAIGTRLGATQPPASAAYGSAKPTPDAAVFGD